VVAFGWVDLTGDLCQKPPFAQFLALVRRNTESIPPGSGSNFNPRNTPCVPEVKLFAFGENVFHALFLDFSDNMFIFYFKRFQAVN
jgi:hypothetical protein